MTRITNLAIALGLALALAAGASGAARDTKIDLVAYSTPRDAFAKILPAFQETAAGEDTSFSQSYGASGEQVRAIKAGLPASVVDLSLAPDMDELVSAGLVAKTWNANAYHGFVTRSVVVFVLRDGNPKKIRTWNDLLRKDVDVITPNPFTSGGARWNVMAAYGAYLRETKSRPRAIAKLTTLFQNVSVQDKSAREALQTFLAGRGDVLLSYENEAILAQRKNQPVYYLIPKATIRIENPVAVTTNASDPAAAKAFVAFLHTPAAQKIYGRNG